jgi:hypothetical protein
MTAERLGSEALSKWRDILRMDGKRAIGRPQTGCERYGSSLPR